MTWERFGEVARFAGSEGSRIRRGSSPPKVRLHEWVQVPIQYGIHIAGLVLSSMVLHELIRLQDVGTDLVAPRDFLLVPIDGVLLLVLRIPAQLEQAGPKDF